MAAWEKMLETLTKTILTSMDLDVETVKKNVTEGLQKFRADVDRWNSTLEDHSKTLARIEAKCDLLFENPTANGKVQDHDTGRAIAPPSRGNEST